MRDHFCCTFCHKLPGSNTHREISLTSETLLLGPVAASLPQVLPQEGLDEPFGPPPEEYLYRCPVCGEEMLVNEAIIDVAVGAAKFRGEYTGGMPTLGCPGCNGETMEYVAQEP